MATFCCIAPDWLTAFDQSAAMQQAQSTQPLRGTTNYGTTYPLGDHTPTGLMTSWSKLCTVISTLRWAVLTVLWIGFCHTGPMSLCVLHICCIIVSTVVWT